MHAGCSTVHHEATRNLTALGYLEGATSGISHRTVHPSIDAELENFLNDKPELRTSIIDSIDRLSGRLEDCQIRAFLDEEYQNPVIEVRSSFDDIQEYRELKSHVRGSVRELEGGSTIYTRVEQIE
jgi:hypothetical protein